MLNFTEKEKWKYYYYWENTETRELSRTLPSIAGWTNLSWMVSCEGKKGTKSWGKFIMSKFFYNTISSWEIESNHHSSLINL